MTEAGRNRMAALEMAARRSGHLHPPSAENYPPPAVAQLRIAHVQSLTCRAATRSEDLSSHVQTSRLQLFGGRRLLKRQSDSCRGIRAQQWARRWQERGEQCREY